MYLVSDNYGDYKDLMNFDNLRNLLVEELERDIKENIDEKDIVKNCVAELVSIATEKRTDLNYIKDLLSSYGWYIQDMVKLQRDINNLREFIARKSSDIKVFDEVLKYMDEEII